MAFDPYELRVGVVLAFVSAARGTSRHLPRGSWRHVTRREMGDRHADRSFEKIQSARRVRVRTLQNYKTRLSAGERPNLKRPCDFARARLWRIAAASLGIDLGGSP
jgi:hypothetical protein